MAWQGKALGAVIGFALGAGPVGALIGAFIGHQFDVRVERRPRRGRIGAADPIEIRHAFFDATFRVMGHLAKADGRVTPGEIKAARAMMSELRLGESEIDRAIGLFTEGKAPDFPLAATLRHLYSLCADRPDLCRMFVQIQLQTALRGGSLNAAGRSVLGRVAAELGVSSFELLHMEALLRMSAAAGQAPGTAAPTRARLAEAYEVLGVAASATDAEVTKAYRRLMSQNHPDKLVAKGLPESMMKVAEEKTRQIRAAYELVRDHRGIK